MKAFCWERVYDGQCQTIATGVAVAGAGGPFDHKRVQPGASHDHCNCYTVRLVCTMKDAVAFYLQVHAGRVWQEFPLEPALHR